MKQRAVTRRQDGVLDIKRLVGVLLVALGLAACGGEPDAPPTEAADSVAVSNPFAEPARRAVRIELGLDGYRRAEGTWAAGDAASTFTAYFDADTLRLIEESLSLGEYGGGTSVYYFEDGALFYAVQDGQRVRLGPTEDPTEAGRRDTVRLRVAFGPGGSVAAAEHLVNAAPEPVRAAEADGVRRHAAALRAQAQQADRPAL